jgi:hypothetical protein
MERKNTKSITKILLAKVKGKIGAVAHLQFQLLGR